MDCVLTQHPQGQHPLRIHLRVNNRCRFKCNHCQGKSNEGVCTDYTLDPILDALTLLAPLQIIWCGGEPLLSPRLAGRFVYHVEIHGSDLMDFKQSTGWDLFNEFR